MNKKIPISIITLLSVATFLMSYLGKYHWIPDLFANFRMYYLYFFIIVSVYFIFTKQYFKAISISILIIFILIEIFPFYKPKNIKQDESSLKIASINLLKKNNNYSAFESFIQEEDFDLFFVLELTPKWKSEIDKIASLYPFKSTIVRDDFFGIGIYSKIPLTNIKHQNFSEFEVPSIIADFTYNNKPVTIIGTHPVPPDHSDGFDARNEQLDNINMLVHNLNKSVIIVGDLNCTSFSSNLSRLTYNTNLIDSRIGFGIQNSWNTESIFLSIPIDHCFVSNDFSVLNRKIGPYIGSDHYPISIELNLE